jgi:type IV secretion system protein VirB10
MTPGKPIRKLNKRLIYLSLFAFLALLTPAIISLASSKEKSKEKPDRPNMPHASLNTHDAASISGVERFPENYGDVKDFEKEMAQYKGDGEAIEQALAELEGAPQEDVRRNDGHHVASRRYDRDNPWQEASMREQKQRASDYYDARRSDIMFIDKSRSKLREASESEGEEKSADRDDMFFVKKKNKGDILGGSKGYVGALKDPSPFVISEGTLIPAILLSEINTDLPGPILARVSHNIWDSQTGQKLIIPQNSTLIGEYNSTVGHGQSRAQILWTRIIYPNQKSVDLGGMVGVDKKGTSGIAGEVDNHYEKVAVGLIMTTALAAGVRLTQGKYDHKQASLGQELGNSLAHEAGRLGNKIADKMLSIKPTIKVVIGERLNVFVETDLNLRPYDG